jgi:hypothetical protein
LSLVSLPAFAAAREAHPPHWAYEGDLKSGASWIQVTPPARLVTDNYQLQQQLRIFAVGLSPLDALSAATICFDYFVDAGFRITSV